MTVTYIEGERLVAEQVEAVEGFNSSNVSRGSWSVLNSGNSDHYAIIRRGELRREWITGRQVANNYRTIIEVWQRLVDDKTSYDALLEHAYNITARIDQYRKLSDTDGSLRDANLTGGSVVTEQWRNQADGPSWLKVELYLDWSEDEIITFAE